MPQPREEGRYAALVIDAQVQKSKTDLPMVYVELSLEHQWNDKNKDWFSVENRNYTIKGWFVLINKDGQPNEINLNNIVGVFDWRSGSLNDLQNTFKKISGDQLDVRCQCYLKNEADDRGQDRLRISGLFPHDAAPSGAAQSADEDTLRSMDQKFGATLRSLMPRQTANTPQASTSAPPRRQPEQDTPKREAKSSPRHLAMGEEVAEYAQEAAKLEGGEASAYIYLWSTKGNARGVKSIRDFFQFEGVSANRHNDAMQLLEYTHDRAINAIADIREKAGVTPGTEQDLPF